MNQVILTIVSIIVPIVIGIALMAIFNRFPVQIHGSRALVSKPEFVAVTALTIIVAILVTVVWGPGASRAQAANGYKQFLNGSIVDARFQKYTCTRDGSCVHTYPCDPYTVMEPRTTTQADGVDSSGKPKFKTVTIYVPVTHWHACPNATAEYSYYLDDSLGRTITVASHIFAQNPQQWRSGYGIPRGVEQGVPARWTASQARLAQNDAEPVTLSDSYTNYILPSSDAVLKRYSSSIDTYKKAGLLPAHTQDLGKNDMFFDLGMQARKMQFVGMQPIDAATWQDRLMRFDAALGTERQGDLHIVVVPASKISNPDDYANALQSYWLYGLGKWGFPKNGIIVVIGTSADAKQISWARAQTGMPVGNGEMITAINLQLQGAAFNPDTILGKITAKPVDQGGGKYKVQYTHTNALLDTIVFQQFPFARACMACKGKHDSGTSYVYLEDTIPVPTSSLVWMFLLVCLISCIGWGAALWFNPPSGNIIPKVPNAPASGYASSRRF